MRWRDWPLKRKLLVVPAIALAFLASSGVFSTLQGVRQRQELSRVASWSDVARSDQLRRQELTNAHASLQQFLGWTSSGFPQARRDSLAKRILETIAHADSSIQHRTDLSESTAEKELVVETDSALDRYARAASQVLDMADADLQMATTMVEPARIQLESVADCARRLDSIGGVRIAISEANTARLVQETFWINLLACLVWFRVWHGRPSAWFRIRSTGSSSV